MNTEKLIQVIQKIGAKIEEQKAFLTELDNVIGDGDHGINLARGFGEVEKKLDGLRDKEPGDVLKTVGMTLVSTVGGASGPLYGTGFMKLGASLKDKADVTVPAFLDSAPVMAPQPLPTSSTLQPLSMGIQSTIFSRSGERW